MKPGGKKPRVVCRLIHGMGDGDFLKNVRFRVNRYLRLFDFIGLDLPGMRLTSAFSLLQGRGERP